MKYDRVIQGTFMDRPNRFIANVRIKCEGDVPDPVVRCHVKNTGRCREILVEGSRVILEESNNPERKTRYDLIAVYKGDRLINIDSQVPNAVVAESLPSLGLIGGLKIIRREVTYGNSRFDIYAEGYRKCFIEVKGVTLEKDGVVLFPDAPTERGLKHIHELEMAAKDGYDAYIILLVQMSDVRYFIPNYETHREFGEALEHASKNGVIVKAYDCIITEDFITIGKPVEIRFR
ncbi:MAG: DNA/RNA nuclease SfsA [Candidatus Methanomethylophilaceae archaeon]|nr:DNA/RNA nuclease SfsA [Candidatus Methanomethylophilaceae archaeon]